jgi:hypothetical protein
VQLRFCLSEPEKINSSLTVFCHRISIANQTLLYRK